MHRIFLVVLAALCLVATGAMVSVAGASGSEGGAAAKDPRTTCKDERFGSTYITTLKQRNTKCGNAKKVAKKFTECRKSNGGKRGHCNQQVAHYSCNEGNRSGNSIQFSARVKCTRGSKKVIFKYTQNL